MATPKSVAELVIPAGRLSRISYLIADISKPLQQFTRYWKQHRHVQVFWDLRGLVPGKIDVATLAAFCAAAQRLRSYAWLKPIAIVAHQPDVLRFLAGVGFFKLVEEGDLFEFRPPGVIGSFGLPDLHPTTQIFSFRHIPEEIPDYSETNSLSQWKDACRERFRVAMLYTHGCYRLTQPIELPHALESSMVNAVLNACAELATNAVLWGRADAFVAVQVGRRFVSAAVCDAGIGLLRSLEEKSPGRLPRDIGDDNEAVFFASMYNRREFGLYSAIDSVMSRAGSVTIASGTAELYWRPALWRRVRLRTKEQDDSIYVVGAADVLLGPVTRFVSDKADFDAGLRRQWMPGLRGTRVSFQLPYTASTK